MLISLLFISNELLNPTLQKEMRLPLDFVTFAHIKGNMYTHFRKHSTFTLHPAKVWGNEVVYGALFSLRDYEFYIRILDAYNLCSLSTLGKNHNRDVHHRITVEATPISFSSVDELERLQYRERESIQADTYLGNPKHPKINQRLNKTNSYRVIDGIDTHYMELIREVME